MTLTPRGRRVLLVLVLAVAAAAGFVTAPHVGTHAYLTTITGR